MKKRYRVLYKPSFLTRFVIADSMASALQYAMRHDVRGVNSYGDIIPWGEIDEIKLWDSELNESQIAQNDEVAA